MSRSEVVIRAAGSGDMGRLADALHALSRDIGDTHRATGDALAAACAGAVPACHGLLAEGEGGLAGAALVSPVFSTTQGAAGAYVSDLWVAAPWRGTGLGRRILGAAADLGRERWQARFLKLTVYADNAAARAFYDRLGFAVAERDRSCLLSPAGFDRLLEEVA